MAKPTTTDDALGALMPNLCLRELRHRRWRIQLFGDRARPLALGATRCRRGVVDVGVIWSAAAALAYRTPQLDGHDPFRPDWVADDHGGPAGWVLRWLMTLPPPDPERTVLRSVRSAYAIPHGITSTIFPATSTEKRSPR